VGVSWQSSKITLGYKLLPHGISEGYAKARSANRENKVAVENFVQIQRNIVENFTKIIFNETQLLFVYVACFDIRRIKKPPRRAVSGLRC
jgi:hypothetical protein